MRWRAIVAIGKRVVDTHLFTIHLRALGARSLVIRRRPGFPNTLLSEFLEGIQLAFIEGIGEFRPSDRKRPIVLKVLGISLGLSQGGVNVHAGRDQGVEARLNRAARRSLSPISDFNSCENT